jgi:hypothetical protein
MVTISWWWHPSANALVEIDNLGPVHPGINEALKWTPDLGPGIAEIKV